MVFEDVGWIHLADNAEQWGTMANTVMNYRVPVQVENFVTSSATISLLRRILLHDSN
jgi:hypothetical protein